MLEKVSIADLASVHLFSNMLMSFFNLQKNITTYFKTVQTRQLSLK